MSVPDTILLSQGELRALLRQHALAPSAESPLQAVVTAPEPAETVDFRRRGLMEQEWRETLALLCRPDLEVRRLLALPGASLVENYYGDRDRGPRLAACHEEGEKVRMGLAREPAVVAKQEAELVDAPSAPPPESGELTLSIEGLSVLAAAVDVLRDLLFTSLLQRRAATELRFRRQDLADLLALGLEQHDARWLVTLLRLLAPSSCTPYPSDLDRGCQALAAAGIIQTDATDGWRPGGLLPRLAAYWKIPLPAAAYQLSARRRDGRIHTEARISLRGDGPLWLVDYLGLDEGTEGAQPKARLRSLAGNGYAEALQSLLTPPPEPAQRPAAPPPRPDEPRCASCGTALPEGARFCVQCGTPVRARPAPPREQSPASVCPKCGAEPRPGSRFCTHCGQPL